MRLTKSYEGVAGTPARVRGVPFLAPLSANDKAEDIFVPFYICAGRPISNCSAGRMATNLVAVAEIVGVAAM